MKHLLKFSLRSIVALLWITLTLYPNPLLLPRSIVHAINPPVDAGAVADWANELPNDPAFIEQQVLDRYVPYSVPWQTYGVPWYYPTTSEVVAAGRGDCEARMLVLASILKAKGIPYRIEASFDHIWVEYPGKQANPLEDEQLAILEDGKLQLPERWDWHESYLIEKDYFWDTMPLDRKLLLFGGLLLILLWRRLVRGVRVIGRAVPAHRYFMPLWRGKRPPTPARTEPSLILGKESIRENLCPPSNTGSGERI